ncbi:YciI family protein [Xanthomonas euvesicatoria]|nr:YciI family protein [Xanthomonas euvesicatoria]
MLHLITLTYRVAPPALAAHLDAHKQWLREHIDTGLFLAAGPSADGLGGIVLAHHTDASALDRVVAQDPFVLHQLVDVGIRRFEPALRAKGFLPGWTRPYRWNATPRQVIRRSDTGVAVN